MNLLEASFKGHIEDLRDIGLDDLDKDSFEYVVISHAFRMKYAACTLHRSDSLGGMGFLRIKQNRTFSVHLIPFCNLYKLYKIVIQDQIPVESSYTSSSISKQTACDEILLRPDQLSISGSNMANFDNSSLSEDEASDTGEASEVLSKLTSDDFYKPGNILLLMKFTISKDSPRVPIVHFVSGKGEEVDSSLFLSFKKFFGRKSIKVGYTIILSLSPRSLQNLLTADLASFLLDFNRNHKSEDPNLYFKENINALRALMTHPKSKAVFSLAGSESFSFVFIMSILSTFISNGEKGLFDNFSKKTGFSSQLIPRLLVDCFNATIPSDRLLKVLTASEFDIPTKVLELCPE